MQKEPTERLIPFSINPTREVPHRMEVFLLSILSSLIADIIYDLVKCRFNQKD